MDHTAALRQIAATYFEASLGLTFEQLLSPIASDSPAGKSLRGTREYSAPAVPTMPACRWAVGNMN